jgi:PI-3-kinase-related kinase SMG-1
LRRYNTVSGLSAEVPRDLLQRELWCSSPGSAAWLAKVGRHARSVATASVLGHLLGLGDRHLDNILVDFESGEVVHIDYNIAFDRGLTLGVPELVPFRLTPVMVAVGPGAHCSPRHPTYVRHSPLE